MKRVLLFCMAALMLVSVCGCSNSNKREIVRLTLSTEDSEAILAAAGITLPEVEEVEAANTTVEWFGWYDPFHNYSDDEVVNTGYWTFTNKYGCEVEWIETDYFTRNDDLANLIMSANSPDFSPTGNSVIGVFPLNCIKGMYVAVDDYIDYTDPLWADVAYAADQFKLGGQHYAIITDMHTSNVCVYNRRVINEWGFEDPATLYANDEWTWDVFYDMCMEFSDFEENRYALDGYAYESTFVEATGMQAIMMDENGKYYSNIDAPELERAQDVLYNLVKNECTYHEGSNRWAIRNGTYGAGLKEGLCLFYVIGTDFFTGPVDEISAVWGDVTAGELMFAPLPRDPDGDGRYYASASPVGYQLVSGGENHAGAGLLAACERFKIIDPTVISIDEKNLKEVYLWTDEMLEMYDTCYELTQSNPVMCVTGNLQPQLESAVNSLTQGITRSENPSTWAQLKEQNRDAIDYYIEEINAMIDEFNEKGELDIPY